MNRSFDLQSRTVVPFPTAKRKSEVRQCAEILDSKQGRDAELYWRTECRNLADRLQSLGCSPDDISDHVIDFQEAVQIELMRLHDGDSMHEAHLS